MLAWPPGPGRQGQLRSRRALRTVPSLFRRSPLGDIVASDDVPVLLEVPMPLLFEREPTDGSEEVRPEVDGDTVVLSKPRPVVVVLVVPVVPVVPVAPVVLVVPVVPGVPVVPVVPVTPLVGSGVDPVGGTVVMPGLLALLLGCAMATPAAMVMHAATTAPICFKDLFIRGAPDSLKHRNPRVVGHGGRRVPLSITARRVPARPGVRPRAGGGPRAGLQKPAVCALPRLVPDAHTALSGMPRRPQSDARRMGCAMHWWLTMTWIPRPPCET
jgi:hypothetical protein